MELEIIKEFGPWGVVILVMLWFMKTMTSFLAAVERNTRVLDRAISIFDEARVDFARFINKLDSNQNE